MIFFNLKNGNGRKGRRRMNVVGFLTTIVRTEYTLLSSATRLSNERRNDYDDDDGDDDDS